MGRGSSYGKRSNWHETLSVARGLVKPVAAPPSVRTQIRHNAVRNVVRTVITALIHILQEP
jgi:hypothetical protein